MPTRTKTLVIDLVLVFVFAILARLAHGGISFSAILNTFWPFAIGTLAGAGIALALRRDSHTLATGAIIWIVTAVMGLGIWGIRHQEIPHISFIIVASVMSGLLLLSWRLIAAKRLQTA